MPHLTCLVPCPHTLPLEERRSIAFGSFLFIYICADPPRSVTTPRTNHVVYMRVGYNAFDIDRVMLILF